MSRLCRPNEIGLAYVRCTQVFSPVANRELRVWLTEWNRALHTIPYLRINRQNQDGPMYRMINVVTKMKVNGVNMEMVKQEVTRAWENEVAVGMQASHTIKDTDRGFDFTFLALDDRNSYVTGVVTIVRKDP